MPFRFNGDSALTYPQYISNADDTTLTAHPGGTYDMRPAGGLDIPVPPADGLWGPEAAPAGQDEDDPGQSPGTPPPPLITAIRTEDEGE